MRLSKDLSYCKRCLVKGKLSARGAKDACGQCGASHAVDFVDGDILRAFSLIEMKPITRAEFLERWRGDADPTSVSFREFMSDLDELVSNTLESEVILLERQLGKDSDVALSSVTDLLRKAAENWKNAND